MKKMIKKLFEITLFKKIFLIVLVCITFIEGFHIYLDYDAMVKDNAVSLIPPKVLGTFETILASEHLSREDIIKIFDEKLDDFYGYNAIIIDDKVIRESNSFKQSEGNEYIILGEFIDSDIQISIANLKKQQIGQLDEHISKSYYADQSKTIKVQVSEEANNDNYQPRYLKIGDTVLIDQKGENSIKEYNLIEYRSANYRYTNNLKENRTTIIDFNHMYQVNQTMIKEYGTLIKTIGPTEIYYQKNGNNLSVLANLHIITDEHQIRFTFGYFLPNILDEILENTIVLKQSIYNVAFITTIFMSLIISYMLTRRIKKIDKTTSLIANNDFDQVLKEKPNDELGKLSKSINKMSSQLKSTIGQLNTEIEKVKELESLRKDFINQFTHEMKTPLGIINGYSELIEESKNEEEVNKYLNIINRETNRVNELIQSMLKLSRLEAKKVDLNKQDIDLEESVVSIVDEYEVLLMKKNIKVEVNVIQSTIVADKKLIETVIHNFLSNAIKHTDENHKIIIDIDNGVSIFNEGKPVEDNQIENIWYTFVTHDREGSGLGLAICRSILELHEFRYGVENKKNGVCFSFDINEKNSE